MTGQDQQASLTQLTSLRFIAALLIVVSHLVFLERSDTPALRAVYDVLLRQGSCGVTFFFILSGFILTHVYERALNSGALARATYFGRRVARIYPLHLMVALACLGYLTWRGDPPPLQAILLNFALLHTWFPDPVIHYSLNGPSWSISDEIFFYAMFPLLVKLPEGILRLIYASGIGILLTGACLAAVTTRGYSPLVDWLFYAFPVTRIFEFLTGILLCRAWRAGAGRKWAGTPSEIALVASVPLSMALVEWLSVPLVFRYQLAFIPPMAALILTFAHGRGALSRTLRSPRLQLLGEASFALYLINRPLITFMERWAGGGAVREVALAIAMTVLSVIAALMAYALVDRPVQAWLRPRKVAKKKKPVAVEATGLANTTVWGGGQKL